MRDLLRPLVGFHRLLRLAHCGAAAPSAAQAQTWPDHPVRFIIPLGPGSGVDITARLVGRQAVGEMGPAGHRRKPSGRRRLRRNHRRASAPTTTHVLLFAPASTFTAHPLLHDKLPYNIKDLAPIARVTNTLIALGVPTEIGVNTVKELVAKIKAAPGKLNYASVTGANDLLFAAFLKTEKLEMAKVPYKDPVTAINDLSENRIQAFVGAYAIMRPRILAGKGEGDRPDQRAACGGARTIFRPRRKRATSRWNWTVWSVCSGRRICRWRCARRSPPTFARSSSDPEINAKLAATGQVVNPGSPKEFAGRAQRAERQGHGNRQDSHQGGAVVFNGA